MVQDLQKVETDRAMILAGISHDLRTPIARMLLEVERLAMALALDLRRIAEVVCNDDRGIH